MIRVAVIDDKEFSRAWLRLYVKAETPDIMMLTDEARSVDQLINGLTEIPDVVVLDAFLGDDTKLEQNLKRLAARGAKVVVFSGEEYSSVLCKVAFEQGALAFVHKENGFEELRRAVELAAAGEVYMTPQLSRALLAEDVRLTNRQESVAALLVIGQTNAQISKRLFISEGVVKEHVKKIKEKYMRAGRPAATREELMRRLRGDGY